MRRLTVRNIRRMACLYPIPGNSTFALFSFHRRSIPAWPYRTIRHASNNDVTSDHGSAPDYSPCDQTMAVEPGGRPAWRWRTSGRSSARSSSVVSCSLPTRVRTRAFGSSFPPPHVCSRPSLHSGLSTTVGVLPANTSSSSAVLAGCGGVAPWLRTSQSHRNPHRNQPVRAAAVRSERDGDAFWRCRFWPCRKSPFGRLAGYRQRGVGAGPAGGGDPRAVSQAE
jgi:hypothetical protein